MGDIKNKRSVKERGLIHAAIGDLYFDLKQVAEKENRSINRQVGTIIREWMEQYKQRENQSNPAK